jgi:D-alanyl-D-alanine carboxypeptidase/D-alanyl-D-alanine-endopeptidase (penicillin-binding protein 4)
MKRLVLRPRRCERLARRILKPPRHDRRGSESIGNRAERSNRPVKALAIGLLAAVLLRADIADKVKALVEASSIAGRGSVGIHIVDLESGETVYEWNANRLLSPASNVKLFTSALGLLRLGADYQFVTKVTAPSAPDARGRIAGSLTLVGAGDPNLSGREIPYRVDATNGDPLAAIEELAEKVHQKGVRRIDGGIIGDDSVWTWDPYPDGWTVEDTIWAYGAPVSALAIGDSAVSVTVQPADPARITVTPPVDYFVFDSRVRTGSPASIGIERDPGSRQVRITGSLPAKHSGVTLRVAVDDPALYAATALRDALTRRGIAVRGDAVARHAPARPAETSVELAGRTSPPLAEGLRVIGKVSQNLHAEMLLRAVGKSRRNEGSTQAGLQELRALLAEIGIEREEFKLGDGSGLGRANLVTAAAVVKLLRFLHAGPERENWLSLLPVGGEDGSLRQRFQNSPAAGKIRAKTGSLGNVTALSGYAERASGGRLAFSILINNANRPAAEVREFVDTLCVLMVE